MGRIHAIASNGEVVTDVAVFRHAYGLVGWGWLYAPTQWPVIGAIERTRSTAGGPRSVCN